MRDYIRLGCGGGRFRREVQEGGSGGRFRREVQEGGRERSGAQTVRQIDTQTQGG